MVARRGGKPTRGRTEPKAADYKTDFAYKQAVREYNRFLSAQRVWRQIGPEERLWLLEQMKYRGDRAQAIDQDNLDSLKLSKKNIKDISKYPRSEHRRNLYKAKLAASPRVKDVRVRKHEKRLREAGMRRPW